MKKLLLILMLMMPMFAQAQCDKYIPKHSAQAHPVNICSCDSCHQGGLNKGTAPTGCFQCHSTRSAATMYGASHVRSANIECSNCHTVQSFLSAHMNHSAVISINCSSCHGVSPDARGKPNDHIPTTAECNTCHKTSTWDAKMNHTGIVSGCASCHAKDKNNSHIPTTAACETCHTSTMTFTGARFGHPLGDAENCESCHGNTMINVTQKAPNHPVTAENCINCHTGTTTFNCADAIEFINRMFAAIARYFA